MGGGGGDGDGDVLIGTGRSSAHTSSLRTHIQTYLSSLGFDAPKGNMWVSVRTLRKTLECCGADVEGLNITAKVAV